MSIWVELNANNYVNKLPALKAINDAQAYNPIGGIFFRWNWGDIQKTLAAGGTDTAQVIQVLNACSANQLKLVVKYAQKEFTNPPGSGYNPCVPASVDGGGYPDYDVSPCSDKPVFNEAPWRYGKNEGTYASYQARFWDPVVEAKWLESLTWLSGEIKTHTALAGICSSETSPAAPTCDVDRFGYFGENAYLQQRYDVDNHAKTAFGAGKVVLDNMSQRPHPTLAGSASFQDFVNATSRVGWFMQDLSTDVPTYTTYVHPYIRNLPARKTWCQWTADTNLTPSGVLDLAEDLGTGHLVLLTYNASNLNLALARTNAVYYTTTAII